MLCRDSNLQCQQASDRRPTPWTVRLLGLATTRVNTLNRVGRLKCDGSDGCTEAGNVIAGVGQNMAQEKCGT